MYSIILFDNWVNKIRHQNDEVTSVTHIEDLEHHFLIADLCDIDDDEESTN